MKSALHNIFFSSLVQSNTFVSASLDAYKQRMRLSFVYIQLCALFLMTGNILGQDTFLDTFSDRLYTNNYGTVDFSSNWIEGRDDGSPTSGAIQINGGRLRFQNLDDRFIYREVPLEGATSATVTFDYDARSRGDENLLVFIWNPGANTFNFIDNIDTSVQGSGSYTLTAAEIASNPRILFFRGDTDWANNERIFIDNVQFSATFVPTLRIDDVAIYEDAGTAVFTVTHTVGSTSAFSVDFTTLNGTAIAGSDYTATTGTLNFTGTPGDTEQITVPILPGTIKPDKTFSVQFTSTSNNSVDISDTANGIILPTDNPRPYEERYTRNVQGNFKMVGNTNLICVSGCPSNPTTNNPNVVMGYSDIDGDSSTLNSSSSNINMPAGATVEYAGLYWGGLYSSTNNGITDAPVALNIDQVKLRTPSSGIYTTIDASVRNIESGTFQGWNTYMAYADVTSTIQAGGNGDYFIADIALATGSSFTGPFGGWTMVIIYNDPTEKSRNFAIWDGFDFFGFGANDTFSVTGLLTPSNGTFESHAGYFGFDGEANATGDFLSINGTALSNALNPNNNTLNGTISEFGTDLGARNPNLAYSWGMDIDVFDATGLVQNSAIDMDVVLGSSNEGIWGGVFVTSNEIAFPSVASKIFTPATIYAGSESTVTITIENPANGVSLTNFSLTDNLPSGMIIATSPDASSSCGGTISATTGNNTFTVSGVDIPAGNSCTFTFDVTTTGDGVFTNTISPSDVSNTQNIPISGESSGTLTVLPSKDSDNDSYPDNVDLDDDNDGIPDAVECNYEAIQLALGGDFGSGAAEFGPELPSGQTSYTYRTGPSTAGSYSIIKDTESIDYPSDVFRTVVDRTDPGNGYFAYFDTGQADRGNAVFSQSIDVVPNTNYRLSFWLAGPFQSTSGNSTGIIGIEFDNIPYQNITVIDDTDWTFYSFEFTSSGANTLLFELINNSIGGTNGSDFALDDIMIQKLSCGLDTDMDGITDDLDLDSDNDGIYDADEAGHDQANTNGRLNGSVGSDGIPDIVQGSGQENSGIVNYTLQNSDASGNEDFVETDSDADGCNDADEAYANADADSDNNGMYGSGTPTVDDDGRVQGASYQTPADGNSDGNFDFRESSSAPTITSQPTDSAICLGCNTDFNVGTSNADTFQWQLLNGGVWQDLTDTGIHSGTATDTLIITNAASSDNGNQYRLLVSNAAYSCTSQISNFVTLTVTVKTVITNRRITYRVKKD